MINEEKLNRTPNMHLYRSKNFKNLSEHEWNSISLYGELTEEEIDKLSDKLNWFLLSCNSIFYNEKLIIKFADKIEIWSSILTHIELSKDTLRKIKDHVDWILVTELYNLDEYFLKEMYNEIKKCEEEYNSDLEFGGF